MCQAEGELTPASVVDHIKPHRGDQKLFWDSENWQSLCKLHHDSDKQMLEKSGRARTKFGPDGRVIW
jgi:5-methylcytosine-specific restriction endonuclease McrA